MKMSLSRRWPLAAVIAAAFSLGIGAASTFASSEANLILPDLKNPNVKFLGMSGYMLLMLGLIICVAGLAFGFGATILPSSIHRSFAWPSMPLAGSKT